MSGHKKVKEYIADRIAYHEEEEQKLLEHESKVILTMEKHCKFPDVKQLHYKLTGKLLKDMQKTKQHWIDYAKKYEV